MIHDHVFDSAIDRLRGTNHRISTADYQLPLEPPINAKAEVVARFSPVFNSEHLPHLTETEFRSLLSFSNNRHWTELERLGPGICADARRYYRSTTQ